MLLHQIRCEDVDKDAFDVETRRGLAVGGDLGTSARNSASSLPDKPDGTNPSAGKSGDTAGSEEDRLWSAIISASGSPITKGCCSADFRVLGCLGGVRIEGCHYHLWASIHEINRERQDRSRSRPSESSSPSPSALYKGNDPDHSKDGGNTTYGATDNCTIPVPFFGDAKWCSPPSRRQLLSC
jgi:hypothetical protein